MNILIAPDKFKGSLSARAVGAAITYGLQKALPEAVIKVQPLADGGDGSLAVLQTRLDVEPVPVATVDPLRRPIEATYLSGNGKAFVELASASGLVLLSSTERNPLLTSTYGTGTMIAHALERGNREIHLLLGGSATHDLGLGIAAALGYRLLDDRGEELLGNGGSLAQLAQVVSPPRSFENWSLTLWCDVTNPVIGKRSAARVYARQKGATEAIIEQLEAATIRAIRLLEQQFAREIMDLPGGGAAGGVGAGLAALFGAKLQRGFSVIADLVDLEDQVAAADIIITGEGKLDQQSLEGKVVGELAERCRKHRKWLEVIVGTTSLKQEDWQAAGIATVNTVIEMATDEKDAMDNAAEYLIALGRSLGRKLL